MSGDSPSTTEDMTLWGHQQPNTSIMDVNGTVMETISMNYTLPLMIVVAVVLLIVIIVTAFGNFLVGLALFKFRNLRTISNFLIGNLAFSDFMLAITILPFSSVQECLGYWVFGEVLCNVWLLADVLYCTASIWNLCIIALDRFTATLYPIWYREKRSAKQAGIYIAVVWMISVAITIPPLLGWNDISKTYVYDNETNVHQCMPFDDPSFVLYSASGSFYVPFLITMFLYIRIFQVLRLRMNKMRSKAKAMNKKGSTASNSDHHTALLKKDKNIELRGVRAASKSCVGSDSADVDEEEDSAPQRSDHPLCVSSSEAETNVRAHTNNGLQSKHLTSAIVVANPNVPSALREPENIQIIVTDDDGHQTNRDTESDAPLTLHNVKSSQDNNNKSTDRRRSILSQIKFKKVNPFKHRPKTQTQQSVRRRVDQREMRATIRMAIIIACFCGCWIGFFVCYVIHSWCPGCYIPRELDAFFFWLGYANSTMNPILYAIFNEEFRRAFQKLLGCYRGPNAGSSCLASTPRGRK